MTMRRVLLIGGSTFFLTLLLAIASVRFFPKQPTSPALFLPAGHTGVILWMESPALLLDAARQHLQEEQRQTWETLIRTWARDALGPEVSVRYDVLPLLASTLLQWDEASGHWTARSTVRGDARAFLDALHASYRSGIPAIRHTRALLDDRFPLEMLAVDPLPPADAEYTVEGWTLRTTAPLNGSGSLISARRGQEIVLGNSMDAVRTHLTQTMPSPSLWSPFAAFGTLPRTLLSSDLAPVLLSAPFVQQAVQSTGATMLWSLTERKEVLTWTLHNG